MSDWKYYAGAFGNGSLVLAKVKMEFRPNIGPRGFYRFVEVDRVFFGPRPIVGTHVTSSDAEANTFDTLQDAQDAIVACLQKRIDYLRDQINFAAQDIWTIKKIKE